MKPIRLGVNIDHVATLRNARGGLNPDPVRAALLALEAGADSITAHLREDRRHIRDNDIERIKQEVNLPLNFEMAATEEMIVIARRIRPHAVCIVPEKREERTTEGGLDVEANKVILSRAIQQLKEVGCRVSLFINPSLAAIEAAKKADAVVVELHTGKYCELTGDAQAAELENIQKAVKHAAQMGLECHAGHGLSFNTVKAIAAIPDIVELNIGHFLIGEALFIGLKESISQMKTLMQNARA